MNTKAPDRAGADATHRNSTRPMPDLRRLVAQFQAISLGNAGLHQLHPLAFEAWLLAETSGRSAAQHDLDALAQKLARAEHEADRLYLAAFNAKDRRDLLLARLDAAFERADRNDVATVDAFLAEAWQQYVDALTDVRRAA